MATSGVFSNTSPEEPTCGCYISEETGDWHCCEDHQQQWEQYLAEQTKAEEEGVSASAEGDEQGQVHDEVRDGGGSDGDDDLVAGSDVPAVYAPPLPPFTDKEVKDLASRLVRQQTYMMGGGHPDFTMVFPIVMLAGAANIPANASGAYEDLSRAMPRGVNGRPMFFSCKFIDEASANRVIDRVKELEALLFDQGGEGLAQAEEEDAH